MNLGDAIGELLPPALGIAMSPIPVIAVVLMLTSARARIAASAFAAGWVLALALVGTVVVLVAEQADVSSGESGSTAAGWVKIILGIAFLLMACRQWRSRPAPGETVTLPGWMSAIDGMPTGRALALGAMLVAAKPKNLLLTIAASVSIAQAGRSTGGSAAALSVFVVIASITVAGPVLAYLLLHDRLEQPLLQAKDWLVQENATVVFVVLLLLGFVILGKGIGVVTS